MASSSRESAMVTWEIQRNGRAWGGEAMSRYEMTPEKTEILGSHPLLLR